MPSADAAANAAAARQAAAAGTRAAGKAFSAAASRAKVPLIAGGAAVAGLAGGLALINRGRGPGSRFGLRAASSRNGSLDMDKLLAGAQRIGSLGEQVGEIATALQRISGGSKGSD